MAESNDGSWSRSSWSRSGAHPVSVRARVNVRMVVIGVLCVCLGGLGAAFAWATTSKITSVLIVQTDVARGELLSAADIGVIDVVLSPGMSYVPSDSVEAVTGNYALSDLRAGSLLVPGSFGLAPIDAGMSQLGLRLTYGRLPTGALPVGTRVLLIELPLEGADKLEVTEGAGGTDGAGTGGGGTAVVPRVAEYPAVVVSPPERLPDATSFALDIAVDSSLAARVAVLAAADRIVVVREGER
ncbi:MAG: hypothetical protein LBM94_05630 [Propionibacteriaceae bacterium]|nr:hypothetical protein [Propionibacteriaceae bacterium]